MIGYRRQSARRRRGASILEFVLILPVLLGFITAIFFFSWIFSNKIRLHMAERHVVWREVRGEGLMTESQINNDLLLERATEIEMRAAGTLQWVGGEGDPRKTEPTNTSMEDLANDVEAVSSVATPYVDELMLWQSEYCLPRGRIVRLWVRYPSNVGSWRLLHKQFERHHIREGEEWHRLEDNWLLALEKHFLSEVSGWMGRVPEPGRELGQVFMSYCLSPWLEGDGPE